MTVLLGTWLGGAIAILLVASLVEFLIVSRLMDDPISGTVISVIVAWLIALAVVTYTSGSLEWAALGYTPPAMIVGVIQHWRTNRRLRNELDETDWFN